jgi:hypothetical protein
MNNQLDIINKAFRLRHKAVDLYGSKDPIKLQYRLRRIELAKNRLLNATSPFINRSRCNKTNHRFNKHPYRLSNPDWAKNE